MALKHFDENMKQKMNYLGEIIQQGFYDKAFQMMADLLGDNHQAGQVLGGKALHEVYRDVFTRLNAQKDTREVDHRSIPANWAGLSSLISGWERGAVSVIASRPGAGRFDFLLQAGLHGVYNGCPLGLFCTALNRRQLDDRLASAMNNISENSFARSGLGKADQKQFEERAAENWELPIYSIVPESFDWYQALRRMEALVMEKDVRMIILDDIQRFKVADGQPRTRSEELSLMMESLDSFARKHWVACLIGSRVDRSAELRPGDKKPYLADIAQSGEIEELADKILFISRLDLYGLVEDEEGIDLINRPTIILSRNKTGSLGELRMSYDPEKRIFKTYRRI